MPARRLEVFALAFSIVAAHAVERPPNFRKDYTDHATAIFDYLFSPEKNYNKRFPPKSKRTVDPLGDRLVGEGNYSDAGADVSIQARVRCDRPPFAPFASAPLDHRPPTAAPTQIRFFKLEEVSITTGSMRIQVWVRHSWVDERLAWDPKDFGNVTEIVIGGPAVEEPDTWLPDLRALSTATTCAHPVYPSPATTRVQLDHRTCLCARFAEPRPSAPP
jgi:hypothetical protein